LTGFTVATHVSAELPGVHWNVPAVHGPIAPGTTHAAPRLMMLSSIPSQSSSTPGLSHSSVPGVTSFMHAPSMPSVQVCVPIAHLPTFTEPARPL
jgi:hypothetical protein